MEVEQSSNSNNGKAGGWLGLRRRLKQGNQRLEERRPEEVAGSSNATVHVGRRQRWWWSMAVSATVEGRQRRPTSAVGCARGHGRGYLLCYLHLSKCQQSTPNLDSIKISKKSKSITIRKQNLGFRTNSRICNITTSKIHIFYFLKN